MYAWLADKILENRKWVLGFLLVIAAICGAAVPFLGFDFTPQQLFESTTDASEYRDKFAERFGREDNLMVIMIEGGDVFKPTVLETMRDVTLELRAVDTISGADSVATFEIPRSGDAPGTMSAEPVLEQPGPDGEVGDITQARADKLRNVALSEPLVASRLVSADGDLGVVLAWLDRDIQDAELIKGNVDEVERILESHPLPDGYSYEIGGIPGLRANIMESLKTEQLTFLPITGLIFIIVLSWLFRRTSGVVLPMGTVLLAVLGTVALLVATDHSINIVNNVLPSLIFVIGISDSIHMLTRDAEEIEAGKSRADAVKATIRHTGLACLLTSTTTSVGFFSLLAADTEILKDFGWQAGAGVMFAYVGTLFFIPAALSYLKPVKRRATAESKDDEEPFLEGFLVHTGERLLRHPYIVIAGSLLFLGGFVFMSTKVEIDTTLLEVYEESHPYYATTKTLEKELGGFLPIEVSLEAESQDRFKDPETYAKLQELQAFAQQQPAVISTQSFVDFHQSARAALLGDPDERETMPESRAQIEQLHLLIAGAPDEPVGTNKFVTGDFKNARVLLRVKDVGAKRQMKLGDKLEDKLSELFPEGSGVDYRLTGDAYVASVALDSFIRDLFYSLLLAIVIIFGMMTFVFRSLKIGIISMLPNTIPLVMTFGYMGWQGINLNTTTIIIFAISLGLAVDDTIHFLARFREELDRCETVREAILASYFGAGRAILLTSVLLALGLAVLLTSSFVPTRQFGILTGITIFGAVFADLILLPSLLYLTYKEGDRAEHVSGSEL
ncbi:MAG: efflux RND transporter permease subunit [Myxococcota bacterium]